jgi:hypothetical protein
MRRSRVTQAIPLIAGLLLSLLLVIVAVPLGAQPASETNIRSPRALGYNKAQEITVSGNIESVVSQRVLGSPAGLHILVNAPEGVMDAHLGPYMTKETKEALHAGTPVQIVGAVEKVRGKEYLLAREITFGGQTVAVRSKTGLLLHPRAIRPKTSNPAAQNGGVR